MQLMHMFKTECIVSLKGVGMLFRWVCILKIRYSNNVRDRVITVLILAKLRNSRPKFSEVRHDPWHTSLYCGSTLTLWQCDDG